MVNLAAYDVILVNSSGGKDSQTMLRHVVELADKAGIPRKRIVVAHADLGRAEWAGTAELAQRQAAFYGLRFEQVARPQGDLIDHIESRGMWPSPAQRYCTSDHKRGQIAKIIVKLHGEAKRRRGITHFRLLNCMGLRGEESPARAKKTTFQQDKRASTQSRHVDTWLPIHDWTETQVWDSIRESGVPHHKAYDLGMPRLSCIFCIFAPKPALILAGQHNPELLAEYVDLEARINHKFRMDTSMAEIQTAVKEGEAVGVMNGNWGL